MKNRNPKARQKAPARAATIVSTLERHIMQWHKDGQLAFPVQEGFPGLILRLLHYNYSLWHREDNARRNDVADSVIAETKHAIDTLNQQRNDAIEKIDEWILEKCHGRFLKSAKQKSETPGSMIDRLSILSLKVYHMKEESLRTSAGKAHVVKCAEKLAILKEQRKDLAGCFDDFISSFFSGKRYFKIYRQFKMYNDATLNPMLYGKKGMTA
jgi:hypothetical protein